MRHLIRVWSGTAQDLNTFFLYDAFLSSSGVFLPLHGWQRRTGRHGRENIQIRISAKVTKVLLTQAPKNTEMLPVSVWGKKCKYYTNFTHCCFGWQWVLCKWNIIQIWVHRISEQHSYVHCFELCKSLCMPAWSDKALVFVLEWTQTEMICNQKPCFDMRLRSKLIWFQREMLLPCGNVWKWAAENIKRRCFKHSVRSLIWHICPSAFFKPFPLQMCHKTSGGFGSAVRPDGKRQRWLCGPVPVRRGRTRYPQNSVPATKTVPLHRRQLWGMNTARMWMVIWDGSHIKVVLQS